MGKSEFAGTPAKSDKKLYAAARSLDWGDSWNG